MAGSESESGSLTEATGEEDGVGISWVDLDHKVVVILFSPCLLLASKDAYTTMEQIEWLEFGQPFVKEGSA